MTANQLNVKAYRKHLARKLAEHDIDRDKLIATVSIVERTVGDELWRLGALQKQPFYRLYNDEGKPTKAWIHAAELALYLSVKGYRVHPYTRATLNLPFIRRRMTDRSKLQHISLSLLFPSTRKSTTRFKIYNRNFKRWSLKH